MINLSRETEALARRLADAQMTSVDAVVRQALEACATAAGISPEPRRPRNLSPEAAATRRAHMQSIVREIAAMPILDTRSPREITDDLNAV